MAKDEIADPRPGADDTSWQPPTRRARWRRRIARAVVLYALLPYLAVTALFAIGQRRLLYPATRTNALPASDVTTAEMQVADVKLHAANGLALHGWHATVGDEEDSLTPMVLYFPGNSGCRADRIHDLRKFTALGCDVLILDYRGYGENDGHPSEDALAADARRAWMFAIQDLNTRPERIILFGESLGGAVAVRLAAELSLAGTPPAGLVLNSTFASLPQTVAWHYPAFPFQFLLLDRYPSADRIRHVTCPVIQFHGAEDEMIPLAHGQNLFDAAPRLAADGTQNRFVTINGGTHNAVPVGQLSDELSGFLEQIVAE